MTSAAGPTNGAAADSNNLPAVTNPHRSACRPSRCADPISMHTQSLQSLQSLRRSGLYAGPNPERHYDRFASTMVRTTSRCTRNGALPRMNRYTDVAHRAMLKPRAPFVAAASGVCADRRFHGSVRFSLSCHNTAHRAVRRRVHGMYHRRVYSWRYATPCFESSAGRAQDDRPA